MRAHGIMFHHFHGGRHRPSQGSMSGEQLSEMIEFIGRERILCAREFVDRAERETLRPGQCCLTFDDNLRCQFDVALPVLRRYNLTAIWFVSTGVFDGEPPRVEVQRAFRERCFETTQDFYDAFDAAWLASPHADRVRETLEHFDADTFLSAFSFYSPSDRRYRFIRDEALGASACDDVMIQMMRRADFDPMSLTEDIWMSPECISALHAGGHEIGLHSHTHPTRLGELAPKQQRREYRDNFMALMELLGEPPRSMAHPCNSYGDATLAVLRGLGVRVGFRSNMEPGPFGGLELPRDDHANLLRRMAATATRSWRR